MSPGFECPRCGASGTQHCSTASGRDHKARWTGEIEERARRAAERRAAMDASEPDPDDGIEQALLDAMTRPIDPDWEPSATLYCLPSRRDEPGCNGICVMGHEVLPGGGSGVAIAHPDCELHGTNGD